MNDLTKKAAFSFKGYRVNKFTFDEPAEKIDAFTIDFHPSGAYSKKTSIFQLKFEFKAFIKGDKDRDVVTTQVTAEFQFSKETALNEIPSYFYKNSIAIVFPYLRAFVSTLTFQANVKPLLLPIMNLSDLEEPLRQNTTVID